MSVRQPWAWLILHAGKDVENRDWRTNVRGRVLIHASKGMTRYEYADAWEFVARLRDGGTCRVPDLPSFAALDRGGIVGSVVIKDCIESSDSPWFFGTFGFLLCEPQPLQFEPGPGRLGFFSWPSERDRK